MLKKNQASLKAGNILSDLLIILLSCYFAWRFRFDVLSGRNNTGASDQTIVVLTLFFGALTIFALYMMNIYAPQRLRRVGENTARVFFGNGICSLLLMAVLFLFRQVDVPRLMIGVSWFVSSLLVSLKHALLVMLLQFLRSRGYNLRHFVLVGSGHLACQYVRDARENAYTGIVVDGYVGEEGAGDLGTRLGGYEDLDRILEARSFDGVVIALEQDEVGRMEGILAAVNREGVPVDLIPFFNDYYPAHPSFDTLGSSRLIDLRSTPLNLVGNRFIKRMGDIILSSFVLILLSPLMLVLAFGVKLSSPGPVIFRQERVGKNKKPFTMYKFRSMRVTGTEKTGWSRDRDPRKTRFGSLIRKCSLDELPQFWNVLKGDMSIVGPRPEVPFHVNHFKEVIPRYLVRQQVRPGITGWAQVNGFRGDTSIVERVRYDIEYIENWTVGLDLRIMIRTLGAMVNTEKVQASEKPKRAGKQ